MASPNDFDSTTNFSTLTIYNSNTILTGPGAVTASLVDGRTVYTQNGIQYDGPVNIVGANLTIQSGAIVDGLVIVGGTSNTTPTITVTSGGSITNSEVFSSRVTLSAGSSSSNNKYVGSAMSFVSNTSSAVTSTDDSFYSPGVTTTNGASIVTPSQTVTFTPTRSISSMSYTGPNVNIISPNVPDLTASNANASGAPSTNFTVSSGSFLGAPSEYTISDFAKPYTITNNNTTLFGRNGSVVASLVDGRTVYTQNGIQYDGPVNILGASLTIQSGAVVDGLVITGGAGNSAGGTANPTVTIANGGTLQNSYTFNGYTVIQSGGVSKSNVNISQVVTIANGASSENDFYGETNAGPGSATLIANGTSYPFSTGDGTVSVSVAKGGNLSNYTVQTSGSNIPVSIAPGASATNDTVNICFLAGTMITTVNGLIAVEDIQIGDKVITYHNGYEQTAPVTWVGYKSVQVNPLLSLDNAGYPVRVLKNAISDGVPYKDLLITSEHCLFLDGQFIPVRMLVNNHTIVYDRNIKEYTYYHIETEKHSVIKADGTLTESYLDTGNRRHFNRNQKVVSIINNKLIWNKDSAAPLATNRNIVEPIFINLLERAAVLGFKTSEVDVLTTNDSGLHLLTNTGVTLYPEFQQTGKIIFKLPEDTIKVKLISKTSRPSQAIGPFVDDRRNLGVLVGNVMVLEKNNMTSITEHLTLTKLKGWDVQESEMCRWTNGDAELTISDKPSNTIKMLIIQILSAGPYIVEEEKVILSQKTIGL